MRESSLLTIETGAICSETKEVATKELRETSENITKGLQELKDLLKADATIKYVTDDDFLILFLRPCKYYAHSAHKLMKNIADYRSRYSPILENLFPEHEREAFTTSGLMNIIANRDQKGRRILLLKTGGNWDPSKVTPDQILRMLYLLQLAALIEPTTQIRGVVVLVDLNGMGLKQVRAITPAFAVKAMQFLQGALPLRLKEFHFINNPNIFKLVWQIAKPLIQEKLRGRIYFHQKDMTSLHKFIDTAVLPEDYGGALPKITYSGKDWYPAIEQHYDFIKKWNSCGKV